MAGIVREQLGEIDPALPMADVRLMGMFFRGRRRGRDSYACYSHSFRCGSRDRTVGITAWFLFHARRQKNLDCAWCSARRRRRAGL